MVVAYVCSVRDFAGKNVISLGLGRKMQEDGLNLAFMKPYGVRPIKIEDEITDADAWMTSQFLGLSKPQVSVVRWFAHRIFWPRPFAGIRASCFPWCGLSSRPCLRARM